MSETAQHTTRNRSERLSALRTRQDIPVLIIGGGINGISTFRELALQGIPAVLVEKGDWCQAASGALSRMIHGGLRYLETGEFALVKESVTERDRLLKNAPHYVAPLRTTIPIDSLGAGLLNATKRFLRLSEKNTRRGALLIKTGLTFYDIYTRHHGTMPKHQLHNQADTRARWPGFADWVKYSATYYDAWITAPERLGMELICDSEQACPQALACNYLTVESADSDEIVLRDTLSGENFVVRPQVVVNATGAWVDKLNNALYGDKSPPGMIGGTKGSHLIIHSPELFRELNGDMVYFENQEGRVCIMFPWFGKVLVGSTDIRIDNPDEAVCEEEEKDYILDSLRFVFPHLTINDSDICYTFCGVRPLPLSNNLENGKISRNHSLQLLAANAHCRFTTLCLVGGKWTTFRRFGEEAADRILPLLGAKREVSTKDMPIGGGRNFPAPEQMPYWLKQQAKKHGISESRMAQLVERYGTRAIAMCEEMSRTTDRFLASHAQYSENELRYLIAHEQVCQLEDLLVRRTSLAIRGELTAPLMEEVSHLLASHLGWSDEQRQQHLLKTCDNLARLHRLSGLYPPALTQGIRYVHNQ